VKSSPCWSPDGSQIVFAMDPGPQLYVMSASGTNCASCPWDSVTPAEPDWSRGNPNKIACTVRAGGYQIAVFDLSTGTGKVVSKASFDGIEPSWLADGRHLVYTARDRTRACCASSIPKRVRARRFRRCARAPGGRLDRAVTALIPSAFQNQR
jgi:TolB protein